MVKLSGTPIMGLITPSLSSVIPPKVLYEGCMRAGRGQLNAAYPNRMGILYVHLVGAYQPDKIDILSDSCQQTKMNCNETVHQSVQSFTIVTNHCSLIT